MPSSSDVYLATQGEAWDQISLSEYGDEHLMHELPPVNIDEADAVLFAGETEIDVPESDADCYVRQTPPWERIES